MQDEKVMNTHIRKYSASEDTFCMVTAQRRL